MFGRPSLGVHIEVLLEKPGREIPAEFDSPLFPLIEGHELILVLWVEHQVEGGRGVGEPALAKGFSRSVGLGLRVIHGSSSEESGQRDTDTDVSYAGDPRAETRMHPDSGVVVRKNPRIVTIGLACRPSRRSDLPLHPASKTLTDGEHPEPLR
jgi:hypothetical protein